MSGPAVRRSGPLAGVKVIELGGLGASPFGCMVLGDLGASVVRVDRPGASAAADAGVAPGAVMLRNRATVLELDVKSSDGRALLMEMAREADVFIEAFRPGVAERLGFGPDDLRSENPGLVYGRMTGWGQDGPLARAAGHDLNYIALAGALAPIGRAGTPPPPPLALVGDMGGGGFLLVIGVLSALLERTTSGKGQVVDAAMVDGAALLMAAFWEHWAAGRWSLQRESNIVDGGMPFYDAYECADGGYVTIAPLEEPFWRQLQQLLDLPEDLDRDDPARLPELRDVLTELFLSRPREEWVELLEGTDTCFAPALSFDDAAHHPHNRARGVFVDVDGVVQPAPAPRFERTPTGVQAVPGQQTVTDVMAAWGIDEQRVEAARRSGALS